MPFDGEKKWGGKYDEMFAAAVENFETTLHDEAICENCESEIEQMLSFAFFASQAVSGNFGMNLDWEAVAWQYPKKWTLAECLKTASSGNRVYVFPQVSIDGYRVDFLCIFTYLFAPETDYRMIAIECDGHDFHEKTKKQAARDKGRDRTLLLNGIPSMRFTGSEIWNDAYECVRQIDEYFWEMIERHTFGSRYLAKVRKASGEDSA